MIPRHFRHVSPLKGMKGEDAEETSLLHRMREEALVYVRGQRWCGRVAESYWGDGVGGIIAAFLFRVIMRPGQATTEEWTWVICGDIPPMYLDSDVLHDPIDAIRAYCNLIEEWLEAAKTQGDLREVVPIDVPPTPEHIETLDSRLKQLREDVLPAMTARRRENPAGS